MEREFGYELARVFGTHMKRVYEPEETALPKPIAQWLERLHRAEQEMARRAQGEPRDPTRPRDALGRRGGD